MTIDPKTVILIAEDHDFQRRTLARRQHHRLRQRRRAGAEAHDTGDHRNRRHDRTRIGAGESHAPAHAHGFGLSIDYYGTGFASMQQLARVPFTELKIDQGFVTGCAQNHAAYVIVEASLALDRCLGLKAVAEGIETEEDWDTLKAAGCDIAQGYFLARPMEAAAFLEFCRKRAGST